MDTNLQCDRMSDAPAIQLSHAMGNEIPVLSHVTCFKLDESRLNDILDNGIHNVFALKGGNSYTYKTFYIYHITLYMTSYLHMEIVDIDSGCEEQQWKYAAQLVAAIRSRKPSVTIGVAGYPESYRLASDMLSDLRNLKSKIDAGADFIITNVCFSLDHLLEYIRLCRQHNILVPIIPGIYVPSSYGELIKMSELSKFRIPNEHLAVYHRYHSDNDAFQAFAIDNAVSLISQIFQNNSENVYGIHFFTMNKYENICKVVGKIKEFQ